MRHYLCLTTLFLFLMNCDRQVKELPIAKNEVVFGVVDTSAAAEMAWKNWKQLYGEQVFRYAPLIFRQTDTTWVVTGTLPENHKGGVPVIEILKTDGKILNVYHTK